MDGERGSKSSVDNTLLKNTRSIVINSGLILVIMICVLFFVDGINSIQHQIIGYDEGYNATVAANVARYGEYRVSYPDKIVFYNLISTGTPVILPTALLYSLFGINIVTTSIIPLIYFTLSMLFMWILFSRCFNSSIKGSIIAAILMTLVVLSDDMIPYVATHLVGEGACLFFLLGACLLYEKGYSTKRDKPFFFAGVLVIASFLTKSSMIFFIVSIIGLVVFEGIIKSISVNNVVAFLGGIVSGFILIDSYKLVQLGSIAAWASWWRDEWQNMMHQSGQVVEKPLISEKFGYLSEIFGLNKYVALYIIILPSILYIIATFMRFKKKEPRLNNTTFCAILWGIAGSSLEVFFVLFGGSGLVYNRRHIVNELFVKFVAVILIGQVTLWIIDMIKERSTNRYYGVLLFTLFMVILLPTLPIVENANRYIEKHATDEYDLQLMDEYLSEIETIDMDSEVLCYGWWQEPDISLFLDREMIDINSVDVNLLKDDAYFIIGRRFDNCTTELVEDTLGIDLERINDIEVDYSALYGFNSDELFSIYKIKTR